MRNEPPEFRDGIPDNTLADWPLQFKKLRRLDAVVDRNAAGSSYKSAQEDVTFLIDCIDASNRRIGNLQALLERERGLRHG